MTPESDEKLDEIMYLDKDIIGVKNGRTFILKDQTLGINIGFYDPESKEFQDDTENAIVNYRETRQIIESKSNH